MAWVYKRALAFILCLIILALPLRAVIVRAEETKCSDILLLFARGSGQNSSDIDDAYLGSGMNTEENQTRSFFDEISKRLTGVSVEKVSLHNFEGRYNPYGYAAVSVESGFTQRADHRNDVPNRYYESVADGAEELTWFLEDRLTSCPFQQVVLGGYSQGAQVVGDALFKLKPNFRPRIAYTALYGDPKFNPRTSVIPIKSGSWIRGNATAVQGGTLLPRKTYIPDELTGRVGSWCDFSDPICANYGVWQYPGANLLADIFIDRTHNNIYQGKWIPQGANEITKAVKDRLNLTSSQVQTITWVNKNDKLYQLDLALVIDTTGSMVGQFSNIKKKLDSFTNSLFNAYWDTRIGIVAFNDDIPWAHTYFSKKVADFTYSKDTIKTGLKSLVAEKGYDEPEAQYSGLMTAMNELDWRVGAQKKILVITDAPAKNPDPGPEKWTKSQVIKRALELDPVSISYLKLPVKKDWQFSFEPTSGSIATATNGIIVEGSYAYDIADIVTALNKMSIQPVAFITGNTSGFAGEPLYFSGGDSYDPDGSIKEYAWDCNNDGAWDFVNSSPTAECSYNEPYSGMVVLEVRAQDGDSAKAVQNIVVTEEVQQNSPIPESPNATAVRGENDVEITWINNYQDGVLVRICDVDGNVLGYAPYDSSFVINGALTEAFTLKLSAGSESGWSDETVLNMEAVPLPPVPTPTPTVTPETTTEPTPTPMPSPEPNPETTPTPIPTAEPTPTPSSLPEPTTIPTPIPEVLGDKILPLNESNPAWLAELQAEAARNAQPNEVVPVIVADSLTRPAQNQQPSTDTTVVQDEQITSVAGITIKQPANVEPTPLQNLSQISSAVATKQHKSSSKLLAGICLFVFGVTAILWRLKLFADKD